MLKNYLTSALRNFWRGRTFSLINVIGLVVGITASTLLYMFVWDELRYDTYHTNSDRIFRVTTQQADGQVSVVTPGPLGLQLTHDHPTIETMARVGKWSGTLRYGETVFEESRINFADNALLSIFDFPLVIGNAHTALHSPKDIVVTESMAKKYFGTEWQKRVDILGSTFTLNGTDQFVVVGVLKDLPSYSSIQFDFLISFEHVVKNDPWSYKWDSHNFHTYLLLKPDADWKALSKEISGDLNKQSPGFALNLQPLASMYLEPTNGYDWFAHGNKQYVIIYTVVASIILVIACFNYVNLSTARARKRSREVGIRKVVGASRDQLFWQFIGESFLLVVIASLISRGLIDILIPFFNVLSGKHLSSGEFQAELTIMIGSIAVIVSTLSGIYPAMLLSSFRPLNVLAQSTHASSGQRFRSFLVTAQFMISMVLVSGTLLVYDQLSFVQSKDLGFNKNELAYIKLGGNLTGNSHAFKQELLNKSFIKSVTLTTSELVDTDNGSYIEWPGKVQGAEISISQMNVDEDFINVFDLKLVKGRAFVPTDSTAYMLNEEAVKAMGVSNDDAIGMRVKFWGTEGTVIGIVKDFHFRPLYHAIAPLIIRHAPRENFYRAVFKIDKLNLARFTREAEAVYKKHESEYPFQLAFVDDMIEGKYQKDSTAAKIILYFSALSVLISTMGLLGLVSFVIEIRTKELSIRKILGSRVYDTFILLSKQFAIMFVASVLMAIPLALWISNQWLSNFAYQTKLDAGNFLTTAALVSSCSLLIIVMQSVFVSARNPATVLKASDS